MMPVLLLISAAPAAAQLLYAPEVSVIGFEATANEAGQALLRWQTTYENDSGLFHVRRQAADSQSKSVSLGYLRLRGGDETRAYEWVDPDTQIGDVVRYVLVFLPRSDTERVVAAWEGVVARASASARPAIAKVAAAHFPPARPKPWIGAEPRVRDWTGTEPADRVRLSLRHAGLYRITVQELAAAGGWVADDVAAALATTNLTLSCQGAPIAWLADDNALLFYGLPAASRYAPENVYWVTSGQGVAMATQISTPPMHAATNAWFGDTLTFQGTSYLARVSYSSLADAPAPFVAFTGVLKGGEKNTHIVNLPDGAPGIWQGTVTINLLSYYESAGNSDDHRMQLSLGGTALGTANWLGEQCVSFSFPFSSTNLNAGSATLLLQNTTPAPPWNVSDTSRFICTSFVFEYPRRYRAQNDALRCLGGDSDVIAVAGFTTNDVLALDITQPQTPTAIEPVTATWDATETAWTSVFTDEGSGRVYHVSSRSDGVLRPAVRGVRDIDWASPIESPEYVILIPPETWRADFRAALQPLADFRNAQGMRTEIIDVEHLYNSFSHGLVDPLAIRAFCEVAHPRGLSYLLLAGSGALDYKHLRLSVNDSPACLIPTIIAGQRFTTGEGMTVALDAALGDADGDGLPDVAVGRLPSSQTTDLAIVVQKTIAYENACRRKRPFDLVADWDNTGSMYYPFAAGTDRILAPLAASGRSTTQHYIGGTDDAERIRNESLFPALRAESALFHFFGHSNEISLGGGRKRLLSRTEIQPTNWRPPTIAVLMGCRLNRWQGLTQTVTILPYGLFAADTGFVGGLGTTGYMLGNEGEDLAVALYTDTNERDSLRLGDMLLRGIRNVHGTIPDERLLSFSLIGDPTLVVRAAQTPAAGTVILLR